MATKERAIDVRVWLDSIEIEGFRSCRSTQFSPNPDLSALIGINGAGKTNVLQGIRLLDPTRGWNARRSSEVIATATAKVTAWFKINEARIGLRVTFGAIDGNRRVQEMVAIEEVWNLASLTGSKAWRPMPPAGLLRQGMKGIDKSGQYILFSNEQGMVHFGRNRVDAIDFSILDNKAVVEALISVDDFRQGISYYSASQFTDPSRCPSSFEVDQDGRLSDSPMSLSGGSVHLRFLHDLYRLRSANKDLYDTYCAFVSRQQLGLISRLTWKEIELSSSTAEVKSGGNVKKIKKLKTLVIPKVQVGSSHITFNQLSEGTFKTLALAFYIVTDASKFLMVEEPEVCVHHGLLRKIIETIKAYAHRKQTIISTHSDLLVDELDPKNLFVVEMKSTGTRVKALESWLDKGGKEALHTYLAESGPLGEYWRSGGLT